MTLYSGNKSNTAAKCLVAHQQKAKLVSKKPAKTVYVDLTAHKEEEEQDSEVSQEWIKIGTIKVSNADKDILQILHDGHGHWLMVNNNRSEEWWGSPCIR